ncbi:MAG: restriction endonuclease [Lentimicrobium sp.]
MAKRLSKAEETALGALGLIGLIVAAIAYVIINYWIILLIILLFFLIIAFNIDYQHYKNLNAEIERLNTEANTIRTNVIRDYERLQSPKDILEIFDNAIIHFPKHLFLDLEYMEKFEKLVLRQGQEIVIDDEKLLEYSNPQFYFNKTGIIIFNPKILNIDTEPNDFIVSVSNPVPVFDDFDFDDTNFEFSKTDQVIVDYYMFIDVISQKFEFTSKASRNLCIWKLLKTRAGIHYSNFWDSNYSQYFELANSTELIDLVKCYCNIHLINHFDKYTITMFAYYLMNLRINPNGYKLLQYTTQLHTLIEAEYQKKKFQSFEKRLVGKIEYSNEQRKKYSISDTDLMNGVQFENFIALLFKFMGYRTTITPASGDQGIDIIAEKDNEKIGIQAKRYSNVVSNSAIQEVKAGIAHYNCDKGMVITNNVFTKSAISLAESNEIILWNRQKLSEIINELF